MRPPQFGQTVTKLQPVCNSDILGVAIGFVDISAPCWNTLAAQATCRKRVVVPRQSHRWNKRTSQIETQGPTFFDGTLSSGLCPTCAQLVSSLCVSLFRCVHWQSEAARNCNDSPRAGCLSSVRYAGEISNSELTHNPRGVNESTPLQQP